MGSRTAGLPVIRPTHLLSRPLSGNVLLYGNTGYVVRCLDNRYRNCGKMSSDNFAGIELGPKMQACSDRERAFIWHYLTDAQGNGAEAARLAGYSDHLEAAKVQACRQLQKERVLQAMEEVGRQQFRSLLGPALVRTRRLLENPDHPDHSKMLQSMLSRLGFSERTGVDVNVRGEVTMNHTDAAVDDLRKLRALGVSRDKLLEVFGHSGLGRYERMLDEMDRKSGRLIEHEPEGQVAPQTTGTVEVEGVADEEGHE